ncbi:MAG: hypothetical protein JWO38_2966, partial [Gemmataceae bacterium]|nr:hypothetical protein [Gemmataceae bacterium]
GVAEARLIKDHEKEAHASFALPLVPFL